MFKKGVILLISLMLCFSLLGCGNSDTKVSTGKKGAPLIRTDAEKLVEIHITDGEAVAYFDLKKWDELFNLSKYTPLDDMCDGAFPVNGLTGKVKDVAIVRIQALDYYNGAGAEDTYPSAFFLMEDGNVEWLLANMFTDGPQWPELFSAGLLNWISDIVSIEVENDGEGEIGRNLPYGTDSEGKKYDLSIAAKFSEISSGVWVWDVAVPNKPSDEHGVLTFTRDGKVVYEIGNINGSKLVRYEGSYQLTFGETEERLGNISFDLDLKSAKGVNNPAPKVKGTFFSEVYGLIEMQLWPGEGDSLYYNQTIGQDFAEYDFRLGDDPLNYEPQEDEFIEEDLEKDYGMFLLNKVPKAREMVDEYGMAILDETETLIGLPMGLCKEIWLGTNHEDKFTREILYGVSVNYDLIYEYDPLNDKWLKVWGM